MDDLNKQLLNNKIRLYLYAFLINIWPWSSNRINTFHLKNIMKKNYKMHFNLKSQVILVLTETSEYFLQSLNMFFVAGEL